MKAILAHQSLHLLVVFDTGFISVSISGERIALYPILI